MRAHVLFIAFFFTARVAVAQSSHTVSMGLGYTDDVYFSLDDGAATEVNATNWHLAFETTGPFSIGIRINDGHGSEVKAYPNADITGWETLDTTGYATWPALNNGITAWADGAFNQSANGDPSDFSWGSYSGPPLHDVVGDSLYVVKTTDGDAFKLRLDMLNGGVWTFTQANLDGSEEVQQEIVMEDYFGRNLVYYNLDTQEVLDREPVEWDFVFTRYVGMTSYGMFPTTGVLLNTGRSAAMSDGVDVTTVDFADQTFTDTDISVIGNDWKELVQFMWQIVDNRCYFVQSSGGDIYKIVFTDFEGSETGNISFTTELVSSSSVADALVDASVKVYPNPVAIAAPLRIEAPSNGLQQIEFFTSRGQLIEQIDVRQWSRGQMLSAPKSSGMHFVRLQYADCVVVRELMVR